DVLNGTDLLYSKVFSSPGNKTGTKYDIGVMVSDPDTYGVDRKELGRKIHEYAPEPEQSFRILSNYGMELR
ncbi:MAG: hypothetical protein ABEJ91_03155, partial [Candidatus Nanohaloarchaea archaeon]